MSDTPETPMVPPAETETPVEAAPVEQEPVYLYPWFKPMPMMWTCVIICIVLIVVGSMMNKAS